MQYFQGQYTDTPRPLCIPEQPDTHTLWAASCAQCLRTQAVYLFLVTNQTRGLGQQRKLGRADQLFQPTTAVKPAGYLVHSQLVPVQIKKQIFHR